MAYLPAEGASVPRRLSVAQVEATVAMYSKRLQIQVLPSPAKASRFLFGNLAAFAVALDCATQSHPDPFLISLCPVPQERFTHELADAVEQLAGARGVLVVVEALHMCMIARGVEKHASSTTTVAARGSLAQDGAARSQLLLSLCLS